MPAAPAYDKPILMLPFDHRSSFSKDLLGYSGALNPKQKKRVSEMKRIVYEGLLAGAGKHKDHYATLADDEYAHEILRSAKKEGFVVAMPVEKSGQQEFSFDSEDWQQRIRAIKPSIVKVLVRYNPANKAGNKQQLMKLRQLSDFCMQVKIPLLFELLVPATEQQIKQYGKRYDTVARPKLVVQAIKEIQKSISIDIWKIEGLSKQQWKEVIAATKPNKRGKQPVFIVLGRNAPTAIVDKWLRAGAYYDAVVGFAVGRTIFYKPLEGYRDGKLTREQAAKRIGTSFKHFASVWNKAKA